MLPSSAFRCADDSLTMHVSKEIMQKIWSGEFINISLLLRRGSEPASGSTFVINEKGQIELKQKQTRSVQILGI